jgi:NADH:ubiquinone oxidoreductase subunit 3 (subunit A)
MVECAPLPKPRYLAVKSAITGNPEGGLALLQDFAFIAVFLVIAIALSGGPLLLAWLLRPAKPNPIKSSTYECGIETYGNAWIQFKVQYYIYALVFVVFDIEAIFLFPWAVVYNQLPLFAVLEMVLFILILTGALVYAWRKGDLEWV